MRSQSTYFWIASTVPWRRKHQWPVWCRCRWLRCTDCECILQKSSSASVNYTSLHWPANFHLRDQHFQPFRQISTFKTNNFDTFFTLETNISTNFDKFLTNFDNFDTFLTSKTKISTDFDKFDLEDQNFDKFLTF